MFCVWQDSHKSTQGWKVSFWGSVRRKFSVNNKMIDSVGNILQNKFYAYSYILLSCACRCSPICGAGVLLRCNWCRNLDAVELHTAVVGNYFCCSRPTLKRPHLAEDRAFYESRSKSRLIASALIFTISWRNFQIWRFSWMLLRATENAVSSHIWPAGRYLPIPWHTALNSIHKLPRKRISQ